MPDLLRAVAWGLAAAAPVLLMMWALAKHRDESPSPAAIDSARAGLAAIFAFMLVVALQPLLFECTGRILDWTNLGYFVYSQGIERSVSPELYAPLVIVVAILVGPILRTVDGGEPRFRRTKRIAVAILSLIIVGIGCTALSLAQYVAGASGLLISEMMPELAAGNDLIAWQKVLAIGGIVLLWTMVGLCTFWLPVYWITSAIVSGGRVLWPALLAGVAVCLIPLFTIGSDAFTFAAAFPLAVLSSRRFNFQDELGGWAETLTGVIPTIIVVVVVVLVLRAFRAIAEHMLPRNHLGRFRSTTRPRYILLLAILIVWPLARTLGVEPAAADAAMLRIASILQGYVSDSPAVTCFESSTVVGFLHVFPTAEDLLARWEEAQQRVLARHAASLRTAGAKAWNVYSIFLTGERATDLQRQVERLEENFALTRKIARVDVQTDEDIASALLPLSPIKAQPLLEGEDLVTLSASMFKKVWLTLKLALDFAVEIEEVQFNRMSLLRKKRRKRQTSKQFEPRHKQVDDIPTERDLGILLSAVYQFENNEPTFGQVFVALKVGTGLRPSEIRALTWRDILLDSASPCVTVDKRTDEYGVLGPPKSKNAYRQVPLTPDLVAMLRAWRKVCPENAVVEITRGRRGTKSERKELKNLNPKDLVFPTENGTYQSLSNIHNRIWVPLQHALELTIPVLTASGDQALDDEGKPLFQHRYTLYSLRHVYASVKIKLGTNPKRLQALMGHASIQLTMDTYGHLWKDEEADRKEAEELDNHYAGLKDRASK